MNRKLLLPTLAAVLALAACDKGVTGPSGSSSSLSPSDVRALAGETGDQDGAMLDAAGGPSFNMTPAGPQFATTTVTTTFTRMRTCPQGGDVKLEGTSTVTGDRATQTGSATFDATRTDNACAFNHDGVTITVTGNPNVKLTASQSVTAGVPGVRTASKVGSFNWSTSNGRSGTCAVNVTHTWTPATHTLHIQGSFCNQTIDVTRTWSQS
jgi:hypothetical protein